jgi:predicted signal transduction protein with EAL and GGDEF domain
MQRLNRPTDAEAHGRKSSAWGRRSEQTALTLANLRLRSALREQAIRDPLTALFDRRYLEETLERELQHAIRRNRPISLMMLDLDHFKRFNDEFGHTSGCVPSASFFARTHGQKTSFVAMVERNS